MKIDGITYYWIVLGGMILPLPLIYPLAKYETQINSSNWLVAGVMLIALLNAICNLIVLMEMWQRFRSKVVAIGAVLFVAGVMIHPYFILFVVLAPPAYWLTRIRGLPPQTDDVG